MSLIPRIGDVYVMLFSGVGHEQAGVRPGVVFQNNRGNKHSDNIIAIPLTSSIKKLHLPTHVFISCSDSGIEKDSIALCENPQIISKAKIFRYITTLNQQYMSSIAKASLIATGGISFINQDELVSAWNIAMKLNKE